MSEKALVILECKEAFENTQLFPLNDEFSRRAYREPRRISKGGPGRPQRLVWQKLC